jgi:hypothetical protein
MKLDELNCSLEYKKLFKRLVDAKLAEILIFDTDANPEKLGLDLYLYFPCNSELHLNSNNHDCGFYSLFFTIHTKSKMYDYILKCKEESNIPINESVKIFSSKEFNVFNPVVNSKSLTKKNISKTITSWLSEWIEELKDVNIKFVGPQEYRRTWALYEENHIKVEAVDPFYINLKFTLLLKTIFISI